MLRTHQFRRNMTPMKMAASMAMAVAAMSYLPDASAQRHGGGGPGFHGGGGGHGYVGHGRGYGGGGGRWIHQNHGGRIGWWWVAGGLWYLQPPVYPVYVNPYPVYSGYPAYSTYPVESAPPVTAANSGLAAPPQTWYYCDASRAYYPYVSTCAAGWKAVPATPPDLPARPSTAP